MAEPPTTSADTATVSSPVVRSALWAAWGDALGFPTELTRDEGQVLRRLESFRSETTRPWKRRVGGRQGAVIPLPGGTYSDDTQLRLAVSRCIRSAGRFDLEAFSKIELPVFLSYGLGVGRGTRAAGQSLQKRGVRWYSNFYGGRGATYVEGGGNGAAMRIQPHVWASPTHRPEAYLPNVLRDAVTTHGHPRAIAGAALHAISLGATLREGTVPAPSRWEGMARYLGGLSDLMRADETLAERWFPRWEQESGESWEVALDRVVRECEEMLAVAADIAVEGAETIDDAYHRLATTVGGVDPATRGAGTVSAVLALWLAWASNDDPASGVRTAANLLGSDTDTVASMAGALVGVGAPGEPEGELLDRSYLRDETARLERLKASSATESFPHPDPLRWQAPSTLADAVGVLDGRVAVAGLGEATEESELYQGEGRNPGLWQWLRLDYGQRLLIKRRRDLRPLPDHSRPRARPVLATQITINEVERDDPFPAAVEDGVDLARSRAFDPEIVARLLLHYARQEHGISKASLFGGLVAQALADADPPPRGR